LILNHFKTGDFWFWL